MVYLYNRILLTTNIYKSHKHYAKWRKQDIKDYILYVLSFETVRMTNLQWLKAAQQLPEVGWGGEDWIEKDTSGNRNVLYLGWWVLYIFIVVVVLWGIYTCQSSLNCRLQNVCILLYINYMATKLVCETLYTHPSGYS